MIELPDWIIALVGRLVVENEMLRKAVAELSPPAVEPATNGHEPKPKPKKAVRP